MSTEKTYRVRRSDSNERAYQLYELTWLWRTAELPHDAEYLDDEGRWRPVNELIEPALAEQAARENAPCQPLANDRHCMWWWAVALAVLVAGLGVAAPGLHDKYEAWKAARVQEREALEREQTARKQDFIASNIVVPNMTQEEVRRIIGPPRSIKATGDGNLERWVYKTQVIVFENGKVIGVENSRQPAPDFGFTKEEPANHANVRKVISRSVVSVQIHVRRRT